MAERHPPESIWRAKERYCVDRCSPAQIAEELQIPLATIRNWIDRKDWKAEREAIAEAESGIRANLIKSRATVLRMLLEADNDKDAIQAATAVVRLEKLALDQQRDVRSPETAQGKTELLRATPGGDATDDAIPGTPLSDEERAALLEQALHRQIAYILEHPVADLASRIRDIKAAQDVLHSLRGGGDSGIVVRFADSMEQYLDDTATNTTGDCQSVWGSPGAGHA